MANRSRSQNRIPAFRGLPSIKPFEPEHEDDLLSTTNDPAMPREERGRIKRYLQYADTFLNGSDERPADNEPVREVSLIGSKRSRDKKAA